MADKIIETPSDLAWIWCDEDVDSAGRMAYFRLTFDHADSAMWTGFADTFYTIYVNGVPLGIGPVTGIRTKPYLTTWDLTPSLSSGTGGNVLAIEVWFDRKRTASDVDVHEAGLIGWLTVDGTVVTTGPAWRCSPGPIYAMSSYDGAGFAARRVVIGDLRGEPAGWTAPGFDDSAWRPATVTARHPDPDRATLRESPIPPLTCVRREPAELIDAGAARGEYEIVAAEDVAMRIHGQAHESLVRNTHTFTVLSAELEATAYGFLSAEKLESLGWLAPEILPPARPVPAPPARILATSLEEGEVRTPPQGASPQPLQPSPFRGGAESARRTGMAGVGIPGQEGLDFFATWDMGMQTSGNVWIEVDAPAELTLDFAYADHLQNGRVNPCLQGHSFADRIVVAPGRQLVHVPHERGFRYLQVSFSGAATLHDLYVLEHVYPHDPVVRFRCADEALNAIWDASAATLHQCSLSSHVDNARRERQGWGGPDLYAQSHGFFALFGDLRLTRKMLIDYVDFFDANGFIPNWAPAFAPAVRWITAHDIWFPIACRDYITYSDDRELAPRLLAASEAVMDYYGARRDGDLLTGAHAEACRWAEWNMNAAQEVSTWEDLLGVEAYRSIAAMRDYLCRGDAAASRAEAERLTAAINARLWHAGHSALAQGTRKDGSLVDHCGQVDNTFAILIGILEGDRADRAYRFCAGRTGTWPTSRDGWQGCGQGERARFDPRKPVTAGTPFSSSMCAQTICLAGQPREALQYIRYNFGAMVEAGEGTLWEMWPIYQCEDVGATCFSQSYGAHIASTIIRCILGVEFAAPGGTELTWRPNPCGLPWVEGRVDTVRGPVEFRADSSGVAFKAPDGVEVRVITLS